MRPTWRLILAIVVGLVVLWVGIDLGWGFLLSAVLAIVAGALVAAYLTGRRQPAGSTRPSARRPSAPRLRPGDAVMTVTDLGGALSEHIAQGTEGVVTKTTWGDEVHVAFTILGPLGQRQVTMRLHAASVRPI